jgi:hypothetical protein
MVRKDINSIWQIWWKGLGMEFGSYGKNIWEWHLAVMVKKDGNFTWQLW